MIQFNRSVRVEFDDPRIKPVEKLRVKFEIEKMDGAEANHARIVIYNLNPTSRNLIARPRGFVVDKFNIPIKLIKATLYAGYNDQPVQLFGGEILTAFNYRVGPDWITEMELYTNISESKNIVANRSYETPTSAKKIADDILSPLGLDIRYTDDALKAIQGKVVQQYSVSIIAMQAITLFLSRYGVAFTIEDQGRGLVYLVDSVRDKNEAKTSYNTFSIKNGLIGTPRVTSEGATFRGLLRPNLKLLQRVFLESETINSTIQGEKALTNEYFLKSVKHIGDTYSDDWYSECEGFYVNTYSGIT